MTTIDPHRPYIQAVQHTLGDLHDPSESWTEYASDDGEQMLMESVIQLAWGVTDATGWTGDDDRVLLLWDQVHGWTWAVATEPGRTSEPEPLITGTLVPDPGDVARAVRNLLDGESGQLPITGGERPHSDPVTLTPGLEAAIGTDGQVGIGPADALALSAYADPIRTLSDAFTAAGLPDATVGTGIHCDVGVRMTPDDGRALGQLLGLGDPALFPMALWNVGVQPLGGSTTPAGVTLWLDGAAAGRLTALLHQNDQQRRHMRDGQQMSEQVNVRVLLLVGTEAEIVADAADAGEPARYPAAEIAEAVGVPVRDLPGTRLSAVVGAGDRLSGWALR
ncbi:DUF6292 family protein [Streptomyces niveus]|uniref:DUF6292 family protein n=1 Tax=Streptomyces niveus TaxID=193462 RepID=UPI0036CA5BD4